MSDHDRLIRELMAMPAMILALAKARQIAERPCVCVPPRALLLPAVPPDQPGAA